MRRSHTRGQRWGPAGRRGGTSYTDLSASIFHVFHAVESKGPALKLGGEVIKALRREEEATYRVYSPILPCKLIRV